MKEFGKILLSFYVCGFVQKLASILMEVTRLNQADFAFILIKMCQVKMRVFLWYLPVH